MAVGMVDVPVAPPEPEGPPPTPMSDVDWGYWKQNPNPDVWTGFGNAPSGQPDTYSYIGEMEDNPRDMSAYKYAPNMGTNVGTPGAGWQRDPAGWLNQDQWGNKFGYEGQDYSPEGEGTTVYNPKMTGSELDLLMATTGQGGTGSPGSAPTWYAPGEKPEEDPTAGIKIPSVEEAWNTVYGLHPIQDQIKKADTLWEQDLGGDQRRIADRLEQDSSWAHEQEAIGRRLAGMAPADWETEKGVAMSMGADESDLEAQREIARAFASDDMSGFQTLMKGQINNIMKAWGRKGMISSSMANRDVSGTLGESWQKYDIARKTEAGNIYDKIRQESSKRMGMGASIFKGLSDTEGARLASAGTLHGNVAAQKLASQGMSANIMAGLAGQMPGLYESYYSPMQTMLDLT